MSAVTVPEYLTGNFTGHSETTIESEYLVFDDYILLNIDLFRIELRSCFLKFYCIAYFVTDEADKFSWDYAFLSSLVFYCVLFPIGERTLKLQKHNSLCMIKTDLHYSYILTNKLTNLVYTSTCVNDFLFIQCKMTFYSFRHCW